MKITQCMACNSTKLEPFINFGMQPLANSFNERTVTDTYPLTVNYCSECSHVQLTEAVEPDVLYKDYKYVSGTTKTLEDHFYAIANRYSALSVLDIGCNDGSLLKQFRSLQWSHIQGVDPAENLRVLTQAQAIPVLVDFWGEDTPDKLTDSIGIRTYDLVTALNCLAHNSNPQGFLKGCIKAVKNNGKILFEFPYFCSTLDICDFGQIYHEHHSYFTATSFQSLLTEADPVGRMSVCEVKMFPHLHGGTIRIVLCKDFGQDVEEWLTLLDSEKDIRNKYTKFENDLSYNLLSLATTLENLGANRKIVAYGASAKSSTLFNMPMIQEVGRNISYVVDDNPLKQGLKCPGSGYQIYSPEILRQEDAESLVILLTVHNFKKEVIQRLLNLGLKQVWILNYTPIVTLEKIEEAYATICH